MSTLSYVPDAIGLEPVNDDKQAAIMDDSPVRGKEGLLSDNQKVLLEAAEVQKAKGLGTFTAIKYYFVAFAWAQFAAFGTILVGYDGSVAGAVLGVPAFRSTLGSLIDGQYVVSASWQVGFNVGGLCASIITSLFYPYIGERLGRRGCLLIACIVSILSIFIEFFVLPQKNVMWFFGKTINGVATSLFASTSSSYAIEVSPLQLRGVTTGLVNFYIAVGQFLSAVIIRASGDLTTKAAFQIPIALQWFFSLFILCGLPFCPESPWVLVKQGKIDQARNSLRRLFGKTGDDIDLHLTVISETLEFEARLHAESKWADMFKGTDLRRTMIIMLIYLCQQVTGVQFVLGYSTYFFELAGIPTSKAFDLSVGTLTLAMVSNLTGIFLINTAGRRNVFLSSVYACTIDCLLIGICSLIKNSQSAIWAMASFTMLYMLTFQWGLGPLTYTYTAEIGSARLRSRVIAWGNICNQFFSLIIQIINPYMINPNEANLQGKVGWLFGGMSIPASIAAWYFIPEIGGRSTDELDLMFRKKIPARQFGKYEITVEDRLAIEQASTGQA